jgi:integrase
MKIGEWTQVYHAADRLGQPLLPRAKNGLLGALRYFLRDCQEWGWIPIRFNPLRVLRTPRPILHLIGPNPRVIDKSLWAKLLWAAMNLEYEDLPQSKGEKSVYPLELVRAVAVVWCFAALRNNEIRRLRVGCVRWQYEDVMIPETGETLPKDATCFLDIPVNKTATAYTKPVHPLVGKRINEWEYVRPKEQLREIDAKTGEPVQFLFSYRGKRIWDGYINEALIPLLCRKAGIPEQDSRGQITSHRARATIASMLYNAKEPLSIFELKEYLGHKHLSSTQSYLLVDPTKLASKVVKAGYLEQNLATIEVLLDQEAVMSGAASHGECWKYYDLGHGWCTNPFWASCAHRMACARCPYYRPKDSLKDQLIEGKASLVRMLEFVQLTEDEKLLVTEGVQLHQELIERLADVPTPAGPTPRELHAHSEQERKVIPLKSVHRSRKRRSDDEEGR